MEKMNKLLLTAIAVGVGIVLASGVGQSVYAFPSNPGLTPKECAIYNRDHPGQPTLPECEGVPPASPALTSPPPPPHTTTCSNSASNSVTISGHHHVHIHQSIHQLNICSGSPP
jgi:hypothetical protein